MSQLNHCVPAPMTVGPAGGYPEEPTAFRWPEMQPAVACTRLVCTECKEEVRARPGYFLPLDFDDRSVVPARARQLHATDDWLAIPGVEASPHHRLYTCTCFYYSEAGASFTFHVDDDDGRIRRNLPWVCAGHPPAELPVQAGDRTIDDRATLSEVVAEAARDRARIAWVRDLFHRTHHGALEDLVPEVVARAAAGPGPMGPALTQLCASETRLAPLPAFTEEVIRYQQKLATADATRREEIAEILTQVVWQQPAGMAETGVLALLRDEALQGVLGVPMLTMFSVFDRAWMKDHLAELMAARPDLAGATLVWGGKAWAWNHPDPDAAVGELAAIARGSGVPVAALRAQAQAALGVRMQLPNDRGPIVEVLDRLTAR